MNAGLLLKAVREACVTTLLFALALGAFEMLAVYVLPRFIGQMGDHVLRMKFVQGMFKTLLGTDVGHSIGPGVVRAIAWAHPIVLMLVWAHAITICTRMPAGEVDRGTVDLLLSLPVSRWSAYTSHGLVWLASGAIVILVGVAGNQIGARFIAPEVRSPIDRLVIVAANLACVAAAVGGMASLVSALSDRRGRAVGIAFAIVVGSFFLSFIAQFWAVARAASYVSILKYYRPHTILSDGRWPVGDMLVLGVVGALCWTAGGVVFSRRDVLTAGHIRRGTRGRAFARMGGGSGSCRTRRATRPGIRAHGRRIEHRRTHPPRECRARVISPLKNVWYELIARVPAGKKPVPHEAR